MLKIVKSLTRNLRKNFATVQTCEELRAAASESTTGKSSSGSGGSGSSGPGGSCPPASGSSGSSGSSGGGGSGAKADYPGSGIGPRFPPDPCGNKGNAGAGGGGKTTGNNGKGSDPCGSTGKGKESDPCGSSGGNGRPHIMGGWREPLPFLLTNRFWITLTFFISGQIAFGAPFLIVHYLLYKRH